MNESDYNKMKATFLAHDRNSLLRADTLVSIVTEWHEKLDMKASVESVRFFLDMARRCSKDDLPGDV